MGDRAAIGGETNTGKSYGRRYIPDGENVMIIQPSIKTSHLFTGPEGVEDFTPEQIDKAIANGTRRVVKKFDIISPEKKYSSLNEALSLIPEASNQHVAYMIAMLLDKKKADYFGGMEGNKFLKGNVLLCEQLEHLKLYMRFVDVFMPWVHTIILPDFTHFITETITSDVFRSRKSKDEAFARYIDLAADSLRSFIKSSDAMRSNLVIVTEYHTHYVEEKGIYKIFTPGGKLLTEKFLPESYYDVFLFTDVKYPENEDEMPQYRYVTRKVQRYPDARTIGGFEELYIPNNLQEVLTRIRRYNGNELPTE